MKYLNGFASRLCRRARFVLNGIAIVASVFGSVACGADQTGYLEGDITVSRHQGIALDGEAPPASAQDFSKLPLTITIRDSKKLVATVTADGAGHFRVALPPGHYILTGPSRSKRQAPPDAKAFDVAPGAVTRVDMPVEIGDDRVEGVQPTKPN